MVTPMKVLMGAVIFALATQAAPESGRVSHTLHAKALREAMDIWKLSPEDTALCLAVDGADPVDSLLALLSDLLVTPMSSCLDAVSGIWVFEVRSVASDGSTRASVAVRSHVRGVGVVQECGFRYRTRRGEWRSDQTVRCWST